MPSGKYLGKKLGEILISDGAISEEQLREALDFQKKEGGLLGEVLVKLGYVEERDIVQALTVQCGFPYLPKLGEILIRNEVISQEQLQRALDFQKREGGLLGEILVKLGYANELDIVQALTVQCGFPYLPLENYELKKEVRKVVPENVARQYCIVPLDLIGNILTVAMSNPLNKKAIEDLEMITKKKIQVFISTVTAVTEALNKLYKQVQS